MVHKELVAQERYSSTFSLFHRISTHSFFIGRFRFGKRVEICHIGYRGKQMLGQGLNGCGELAMQLGIQIPIPACICNVFDFLVVYTESI